jgi:hypothetical protein
MMAIMHVPGHIFAPIAELGIANVMHIPCHHSVQDPTAEACG